MEDKPLSLQVYEKIKEGIISLKFPPGTVLKERELSESLGVSRTPVREAIQRLLQEAWLVPGEGKRMQVRPITLKDVYEIIQIRNIVEYSAIEILLKNGETRVVAGNLDVVLNSMREVSDENAFVTWDIRFHNLLIKSMKNQRLLRFWSTVQDEVLRMGLLALRGQNRWEQVILEHEALVEALWNKNPEDIKKAMYNHLEHSYISLIANLEECIQNTQEVQSTIVNMQSQLLDISKG